MSKKPGNTYYMFFRFSVSNLTLALCGIFKYSPIWTNLLLISTQFIASPFTRRLRFLTDFVYLFLRLEQGSANQVKRLFDSSCYYYLKNWIALKIFCGIMFIGKLRQISITLNNLYGKITHNFLMWFNRSISILNNHKMILIKVST